MSPRRLSLRRVLLLAVVSLTLAGPPSGAYAATLLALRGQKAVLEYIIDVDGKSSGRDKNYEYQHWSTRRSLVVKATLVAEQPSIQDPGDPGGLHKAASRPNNEAFQPSPEMAALLAEMGKCGENMDCRMRVTQKMMQNPKVQADIQKARKEGESLAKGSPRYQVWYPDRKTPATGTVSMEVQKDERFKTAVDERHTCREAAEVTVEGLMHGAAWPATIKIDAQRGTYAANIGDPGLIVLAKTDCVSLEGRKRSEQHSQSGVKFLPEKYQQGATDDIEVFRGGADAATGGRRLAHGEKVLIGLYGEMGGVPMTAKVTVRWSVTLKD